MNCPNCNKPLPEIGELKPAEIVTVKRVCSCGAIHLTEFAKPSESKLGHIATIRYGNNITRVPVIGEWRDRWNARYFYVAIWEATKQRFLSFAENSYSLQEVSFYPMQMTVKQQAMARAIHCMKRVGLCQRLANRYLAYESASIGIVALTNSADISSYRDEFNYEFNETEVKKRALMLKRRDTYISMYQQALVQAELTIE